MTIRIQPPRGALWVAMVIMGACVLVSLALLIFATSGIDSPVSMPHGTAYVAKATVALLVYGAICAALPLVGMKHSLRVFQSSVTFGIIGGILQIIHMALENFGSRVGENSAVTLGFMLAGFVIWGAAGYWLTRASGDMKAGVVASSGSAMVSVLMAVTFGLVLMSANIPPPDYVATWSEFKGSGWSNAHAFAIANSFDAVFSHLVIGPIAGAIFGIIGGGTAKALRRRTAPAPSIPKP